MTGRGEGESDEALAVHRLGRSGVQVKLDKGFEEGTYCVWVEYNALSDRIGFSAARRQALEYCGRLKGQLAQVAAGYDLGETEDTSRSGDPRRKRNLEMTFLSFAVTADDGRYHDAAIKEQFRIALLRAQQSATSSRPVRVSSGATAAAIGSSSASTRCWPAKPTGMWTRRRGSGCSPRSRNWPSRRRSGACSTDQARTV